LKQQLLNLFASTPVISAKGPAFADDLAEDLQAVIIRALGLVGADPQLTQIEKDVDDLFVSHFGVQLSNLLFSDYRIEGAQQKAITRAMLQTFLLEHGQGLILKKRLLSLAAHN
jgi:hypothetical protein